MKKIVALIVALMTVATLVACGGSANASTDEAKTIVILSPNQYESYIFDSEEDAHSFVEARRIYMDGDIFTQRMVAAVYDDVEFEGRKGKREEADGFVLLHVDNGREWFIEGDVYDFRDQHTFDTLESIATKDMEPGSVLETPWGDVTVCQ